MLAAQTVVAYYISLPVSHLPHHPADAELVALRLRDFVFCQTQQIVRRHAVELCQHHDGKGAYILEILRFIFAEGGFGKPCLLCKLFQVRPRSTTRKSFKRSCIVNFASISALHKRGNHADLRLFSILLDIREEAHFFATMYLTHTTEP